MSRYAGRMVSEVLIRASDQDHPHTTTIPANVIETVELIRDLGDGGCNDCTVQRNEKYRDAKCKPMERSVTTGSYKNFHDDNGWGD